MNDFRDPEVKYLGQKKGYGLAVNPLKSLWTRKSTFTVDGPNRDPPPTHTHISGPQMHLSLFVMQCEIGVHDYSKNGINSHNHKYINLL